MGPTPWGRRLCSEGHRHRVQLVTSERPGRRLDGPVGLVERELVAHELVEAVIGADLAGCPVVGGRGGAEGDR